MLWLKNRLEPILNSNFLAMLARSNADLHGAWEFCFIVSSSYVIAFDWSTFFVHILCLIAFVFDLSLWRLKAILMHWTSIFFLCLYSTTHNSWNSEIEYWIIIIILFCCGCFTHLLSIVWFTGFCLSLTTWSLVVCSFCAFHFNITIISLIYSCDRITLYSLYLFKWIQMHNLEFCWITNSCQMI